MAHTELSLRERRRIEDMLVAKASVARIAAATGRHRSTIYREIRRNAFVDREIPELNGYYGLVAQKQALCRRARRRKLHRLADLRQAVIGRLEEGWTPEQIAGRLRFEHGDVQVSHETIYVWVYGPEGRAEDLARHLPSRRKKRRLRGSRKPRDLVFPPERSIHRRPGLVKSRRTFGHWEGDLMIFERAAGKMNVASLIERKTRFAVLFRNNDRSSAHFMGKLMDVFAPLPQPARRSITFDRGLEFREWRRLKPGIGTQAWFCDPQAPWQKGAVENLNRRARRWLPRSTPVAMLSDEEMKKICARLNATPRKCLGWRTPLEAFRDEMRKLR